MRYGTKPAEYVITKSGERIGIALTSDFCSEHEQGIQPIYNKLGLQLDKIGYKSRIIAKGLFHGQIVPKDKTELYFYISTLSHDKVPSYINHMRAKRSDQEGPHTDGMWDKDDFIFYTNDYIYAKSLFERLSQKGNSVLIGRRMAAFDNGILFIVLKDSLDKQTKDELERVDSEARITEKLAKKDNLKGIFDRKRTEWRELYNSDDSPWDYYAMSPRLNEYGKVSYWLNPGQQQHLNFGWYSKEELLEWLEGKGPVPMSQDHWKHLTLITKIKRNFCMSTYNTEHYNLYQKCRSNETNPAIQKAIVNGKLDKKAIEAIESMVKSYCSEFPRYSRDYFGSIEPTKPESFRELNAYMTDQNRTNLQDRQIHMFLSAYAEAGLLDRFGACNTPTQRTNKNWWANLLDEEIRYEAIMDSGVFTEEEQKFIKSFNPEKEKKKIREKKK